MKPRDYVYWFLIALFVVPLGGAVPEVRPTGDATVFVNGAVDAITICEQAPLPRAQITITAPNQQQLQIQGAASLTGPQIKIALDGTILEGNPAEWTIIGNLNGAPADGTWRVDTNQNCVKNPLNPDSGREPLYLLEIQGKAIEFGTGGDFLLSWPQFWNWHETTGKWTEPSSASGEHTESDDPLNEGPEENPEFARYFADEPPAPPTVTDDDPAVFTAHSTTSCPTNVQINGVGARGQTQTGNTFGRFWYIDGFQPSSADLSLLGAAQSTTITDLGASFNFTHNATVFYNGVAGTSYQFEARNGTTGEWQKGRVMFAPPLQCTQEEIPNLELLEHDEGALQIQTQGGYCKGQRIVLNVMLDKPLLGGEMFEVFIANASSGLVLGTFGNTDFNVDPGDVNYFNSFAFPSGEYVAVVLADLQGSPAYDHFDSFPVSVSPESCVVTFSDQSLELTLDVLLQIQENATTTRDGALLVNNMDFEGLSFDGFLFFLLFAGFMAWCLWHNYPFPALGGLLGAMSLFYASFPVGVVGFVFLCLLLLWLEWWRQRRLDQKKRSRELL